MRPIAVLSAVRGEVEELHRVMKVDHESSRGGEDSHGQRDYWAGTIFGAPVVVAWSRWGKVAAASTTTHIIDLYEPAEIVFVGLAGSLRDEVRIGDVVVGTSLINHDLDARPLFARHEVPLLGMTELPTSPELTRELSAAAEHFVRRQLHAGVPAQTLASFCISDATVHRGQIACGDQFISESGTRRELAQRLPQALCTEMEGAAVAQVAHEHGVEFGVVRTISDGSDDSAATDFEAFLTEVASPYSHGILRNYLTAKTHQL